MADLLPGRSDGDNLPVRSAQSMFEALKVIGDQYKDLPPVPSGFLASHSVPYGRVFNQWDTKGRLWVWCNRGEVADLPWEPAPRASPPGSEPLLNWGIPVYYVR